MNLSIDLNDMNAEQIAMLDAVVSSIGAPSKIKNEIIDAGYANCGEDEYRKLYMQKCDALNGKAIASAVLAEREACEAVCFSAGIHTVSYNLTGDTGRGYNFAMRDIAAAIRARSNNGEG